MRRLVVLLTLLASGVAHAAPTMEVQGWCPSVTVQVSGATPARQVSLYTGTPGGTTTLDSGRCAGTTLDVADANDHGHLILTATSGRSGTVTATPSGFGPGGCANSVQAIDLSTCAVTDAVPLTPDCSSLEDGLVAYWPADGDTNDAVGLHDGTIEGTVDYAPGVFGDAFEFDGWSAVKVRSADDLAYDDGEPFTYAMWVYDEGTQPYHLFGKRYACRSGPTFDYQLVVENGHLWWGTKRCAVEVSPVPSSDTWHHIVAMYDGTAFSLYVDGELGNTGSTCGSNDIVVLGGELRIGSSGTCGTNNHQGWVGLVDDVALWNRTLDENEVACASNGGLH